VGKGGVVRDPSIHRQVLVKAVHDASENDLAVIGLTVSPIIGPAGNHEFLLLLGYQVTSASLEVDTAIEDSLALINASSE